MRSIFHKLRHLKISLQSVLLFLKLARNPENTDSALALSDKLLALGLFDAGVELLKSDPRTAGVFKEPYTMPLYDLDQLLTLPVDSLGHELGKVMKEGNLDPNYFRRDNPLSEGKKILDHIEQTHDIWHIVLGFDTSVPGEVGILAFEFGQLRAPQAAVFMAGAILRCLFTNLRDLPPIMEAIEQGWRMSKTWAPLFAVQWNGVMDLPVEYLRDQLSQGTIPTISDDSLEQDISSPSLIKESAEDIQ